MEKTLGAFTTIAVILCAATHVYAQCPQALKEKIVCPLPRWIYFDCHPGETVYVLRVTAHRTAGTGWNQCPTSHSEDKSCKEADFTNSRHAECNGLSAGDGCHSFQQSPTSNCSSVTYPSQQYAHVIWECRPQDFGALVSTQLQSANTIHGLCDSNGMGRWKGRAAKIESVQGLDSYITNGGNCGCCVTVYEESEVYFRTIHFETNAVLSTSCAQRIELYDSYSKTTQSTCNNNPIPNLLGCTADRRMYFLHYINTNATIGVKFSVSIEAFTGEFELMCGPHCMPPTSTTTTTTSTTTSPVTITTTPRTTTTSTTTSKITTASTTSSTTTSKPTTTTTTTATTSPPTTTTTSKSTTTLPTTTTTSPTTTTSTTQTTTTTRFIPQTPTPITLPTAVVITAAPTPAPPTPQPVTPGPPTPAPVTPGPPTPAPVTPGPPTPAPVTPGPPTPAPVTPGPPTPAPVTPGPPTPAPVTPGPPTPAPVTPGPPTQTPVTLGPPTPVPSASENDQMTTSTPGIIVYTNTSGLLEWLRTNWINLLIGCICMIIFILLLCVLCICCCQRRITEKEEIIIVEDSTSAISVEKQQRPNSIFAIVSSPSMSVDNDYNYMQWEDGSDVTILNPDQQYLRR